MFNIAGILRRITLPAIAFLASVVVCPLQADVPYGKSFLIINSYDSEFKWTRDQVKGFVTEVKNYDANSRFFCEYLDAKRIDVKLCSAEFAELLQQKYQDKTIALIYATDDIALEFIQANAGQIGMGGIPIIASGINNKNNLRQDLHQTTTGIHEAQSAKDIVMLALKQNPNTKRILIVCDSTTVGQDIANDIDEQARAVSNLPVERLTDRMWSDTLAYIRSFDRDTLFLLGLYAVDQDGCYIQPYDVATQVSKVARGPVYAFHDIFTVSPGVVGGYVNAGLDQGRMAGRMAVNTIADRAAPPLDIGNPGFAWVFNYGAMKRFGISMSSLPQGSTVFGEPENIVAKHPYLTASVIMGILAQTVLILFLLLNIRRRIAATTALKHSEARLRLLLEHSPLAIFISDNDGNLILLNSQFRTLFGYGISDARSLEGLKSLLIPDPEYRTQVTERMIANTHFALANGIPPIPIEFVAKAKNGRSVEVEMYFAEAGDMRFRILHDVTERNRVMRELREASTAATAANEAKSRFIANVSHEIRTPMNGILGMVQLLHETPVSPDQRDYLETIGDSCSLLLTVINDILDLSRIEAGQMRLNPEPVLLRTFLKNVVNMAGTTIEGKGLEFIYDIPDTLPKTILCDPNRVKQVLLNLLANASKFTDRGKVELRVKSDCPGGNTCTLYFEVIDTGIGIPRELQEKIFEPFTQGDASQTRKFGGTGLGLAISRKLVLMMGGSISLKSEVGKGTTFSFNIPVDILPGDSASTSPDERIDTNTARNYPLRILVAEDNLVNQKVVGMMLRKMGYDFETAANGVEAVDAATRKRFDIILMDVQMPVMDGIAAAVKIRAALPPEEQPHIYALTAHAMNDDAQQCMDAGMNGHLTKPLRVGLLRGALVNAYTEIRSAEKAHH